jgi:hypothetical protein
MLHQWVNSGNLGVVFAEVSTSRDDVTRQAGFQR